MDKETRAKFVKFLDEQEELQAQKKQIEDEIYKTKRELIIMAIDNRLYDCLEVKTAILKRYLRHY
jgi:hypothetical protein